MTAQEIYGWWFLWLGVAGIIVVAAAASTTTAATPSHRYHQPTISCALMSRPRFRCGAWPRR